MKHYPRKTTLGHLHRENTEKQEFNRLIKIKNYCFVTGHTVVILKMLTLVLSDGTDGLTGVAGDCANSDLLF